MCSKRITCFLLAVSAICLGAGTARAQETSAPGSELKFVLIMTRHGVRTPTWQREQLNQYSVEPWPDEGVPPGELTPYGRKLMTLFGAYDGAYLRHAGLLSATGCADVGRVYFWADNGQRCVETGHALAEGIFPDCSVEVHSLPRGTPDPLFSPVAAGIGHSDRKLAAAAVLGRIGGDPAPLLEAYQPAFEAMQQVLLGCQPGPNCPSAGKSVQRPLMETPSAPAKGDRSADLRGPLSTGSTLAEDFLLEYTNGMTGQDLGWGRVNESNLRLMMSLHVAYADLARRTSYIARTSGSNLLDHILRTMQQAVEGKPVPGALGKPGDRLAVIAGHDGNLSNIAGILGLSWLIEGDLRDDTPPGGALVFELWRNPDKPGYSVHTYYMAQTLKQMHDALPLTLESPPAKAVVFLPGCSTAEEGLPCGWEAFQRALQGAIDPAFVKP
jgi:4-phytase/acid phosphatase